LLQPLASYQRPGYDRRTMSTTQAMRYLDQRKILYQAREYEHQEKGAEYAAEALGWPLDAMIKTLVTVFIDRTVALVLMPGDRELSLKTLARSAGVKQAAMAPAPLAERFTGYQVGGISPFGTRTNLPVWMDTSLLDHETVGINGGRRGLILFLKPAAVRDALDARMADLSQQTPSTP